MRAFRVAAGLMMGALGLLSIFLVIQRATPPGNSEAATIVTSARAPDIVTQGPVSGLVILAVVVTALFAILAITVTLALLNKSSTLKSRTRNGLRLNTMNFLSRISYTASGDADVGHRQPRRTFGQIVDDLFSGLGSHKRAPSVPFPC